ncbi:MAG: WG repeat-containing protein [Bacteroidota bacterium]
MNVFFRGFIILILSIFSITTFAQKGGPKGKQRAGYDVIHPYKNGRAKVEKNKKQGFIHADGDEFVPCKYDNIYPWEKGRAKVEIAGRYGFINEAGEEYIPVKYDFIGPYKNGLAIVSLNGRRGLINEAGEEVVTLDNEK